MTAIALNASINQKKEAFHKDLLNFFSCQKNVSKCVQFIVNVLRSMPAIVLDFVIFCDNTNHTRKLFSPNIRNETFELKAFHARNLSRGIIEGQHLIECLRFCFQHNKLRPKSFMATKFSSRVSNESNDMLLRFVDQNFLSTGIFCSCEISIVCLVMKWSRFPSGFFGLTIITPVSIYRHKIKRCNFLFSTTHTHVFWYRVIIGLSRIRKFFNQFIMSWPP